MPGESCALQKPMTNGDGHWWINAPAFQFSRGSIWKHILGASEAPQHGEAQGCLLIHPFLDFLLALSCLPLPPTLPYKSELLVLSALFQGLVLKEQSKTHRQLGSRGGELREDGGRSENAKNSHNQDDERRQGIEVFAEQPRKDVGHLNAASPLLA